MDRSFVVGSEGLSYEQETKPKVKMQVVSLAQPLILLQLLATQPTPAVK